MEVGKALLWEVVSCVENGEQDRLAPAVLAVSLRVPSSTCFRVCQEEDRMETGDEQGVGSCFVASWSTGCILQLLWRFEVIDRQRQSITQSDHNS